MKCSYLNDIDLDKRIDLTQLRASLRRHYAPLQAKMYKETHPLEEKLNAFANKHPELNAYALKCEQYDVLSRELGIEVFNDSPFYFVTDACYGPQAGFPYYSAGGWLLRHNYHVARDVGPEDFDGYVAGRRDNQYTGSELYFDCMHYCYPVGNVVKNGLKYYYEKALQALNDCKTEEEKDFITCAIRGLEAARTIMLRFADAAQARLKTLTDEKQRANMRRIAETARRVPWEKPEHFYEGLNTIWFCRDTLSELDGIGSSHLGRPDQILWDLYKNDIESGYMTAEEAFELVSKFIVHGDSQYDKDQTVLYQNDHELEMGYVLGGCDENGEAIYNDITTLFLRAHRAQKAIYPKPHCRFGGVSPDEYIDEVALDFVRGRNVSGFINDDAIIPALVKNGIALADARNYINYGCWGINIENKTNVSGGNFVHMLTAMERAVHGETEESKKSGCRFEPFEGAQNFDELYAIYFRNLMGMLKKRLERVARHGKELGPLINPLGLFSVCIDGCLESKTDCNAGGSIYQLNEFSLAELSNAVDGLLAMKTLCFDKKEIPLADYLQAVRDNWQGHEDLRKKVKSCPHYGDESEDSIALTKRLFNDIYEGTRNIPNQFGLPYVIDLFVYQEFRFTGEQMKATPDGRRDGEALPLGVNPTRLHDNDPLPAVLNSIAVLDTDKIETHSVTLQLPSGKLTPPMLRALLRAAQSLGMKHIQFNCIDPEALLDAQKHPEDHQDLVVRICGFSAKFVSLSPAWQEEFIHRTLYEV